MIWYALTFFAGMVFGWVFLSIVVLVKCGGRDE